MLKSLQLIDFRCYASHQIEFKDLTIAVGRNNAGKSSLIEALRLVSLASAKSNSVSFSSPPDWTDAPGGQLGFKVPLKGLFFEKRSVINNLGSGPARIIAKYDSGYHIEIFVSGDYDVFASYRDPSGQTIRSGGKAKQAQFPPIAILPPIGPLEPDERLLSHDHVRGAMESTLTSKHFRNQIHFLQTYVHKFKTLVAETWENVSVEEVISATREKGEYLSLMVRDEQFTAEVGWMGHGFQMWLQVIWFLARSEGACTLILDEPDVYMHPDLQRRLIRLVRKHHTQVIVATHSVEIMTDVPPSNILVVERSRSQSRFVYNSRIVQKVADNLGSQHNLNLVRLGTARCCLVVEGKDMDFLRIIHQRMFPDRHDCFDGVPNFDIGGWGGWKTVSGVSKLLHKALSTEYPVYCLLDRDYFPDSLLKSRQKEAKSLGINLHIWRKKEIENYSIDCGVICRFIKAQKRQGSSQCTEEEIEEQLLSITKPLKQDVIDCLATEEQRLDGKLSLKSANEKARSRVGNSWKTLEGRLAYVCGKEVLTQLSKWSQKKYQTSISAKGLFRHFQPDELPEELRNVIAAIDQRSALDKI
ncbi:MAG: AAA family ATPase [Candidatus Sumerlaeaceae bacterium]|nr:AAA family ATPase [Candidatus Sumerlaeaceae bacterium]